jgi:hypothetical protein
MPKDQLSLRIIPILANIGDFLREGDVRGFKWEALNNQLLLSGKKQDAEEAEKQIGNLQAVIDEIVDSRQLTIMDRSEDIDVVLADILAEEVRYGPFDLEIFDYVQMFSVEAERVSETRMETMVAERFRQHGRRSEAAIIGISSFTKHGGKPGQAQFRGSNELMHKAMYAAVLYIDEEALKEWNMLHPLEKDRIWKGLTIEFVKSRGTSATGSLLQKPIPIIIDEATGAIKEISFQEPM